MWTSHASQCRIMVFTNRLIMKPPSTRLKLSLKAGRIRSRSGSSFIFATEYTEKFSLKSQFSLWQMFFMENTMNRSNFGMIAGGGLILLGVLLLIEKIGLLHGVFNLFWGLLFVAGAVYFIRI